MHEETTLRVRIDLAYDGSAFHGWATQPEVPTVQDAVETGLATIFRHPVRVTVAGRTDAGVHAANQVIHFDIAQERWQKLSGNKPLRQPEEAIVTKLNGVLARRSDAIRIHSARVVPPEFDARFSPISRRYRYRISNGLLDPLTRHFTYHHRQPLNIGTMAAEIEGLSGLFDFGSFCKPRPGATTIRNLHVFAVEATDDLITVWIAADAFCHHMVRALIGALLQVGDGSRAQGWLRERLDQPVRDSHMSIAPARGLILDEVLYPTDDEVGQRARQTRAKRDTTTWSCC